MMKVYSKVMVTSVQPGRPLAYTRQPISVSVSVHNDDPATPAVHFVLFAHDMFIHDRIA
jgi:hypothetical protein